MGVTKWNQNKRWNGLRAKIKWPMGKNDMAYGQKEKIADRQKVK